jgi:hypothetical protein
MRRLLGMAVSLACFLSLAGEAAATCVCRCVNGDVQALCSSSIDVPPVCAPRVCPIMPPSVAPIQAPQVPPIGTTDCRQAQVFNQRTGQYEWREVCR